MGRRRQEAERARARRQRAVRQLFVVGAVAVAVLIVAVGFALQARSSPARHQAALGSGPIDGIPCGLEQVAYHEHAHLSILIQGKPVAVPNNVGHRNPSNSPCLYWLHTHNPDGIIHLEAPHRFHATLGTFFDVWRQPLSRSRVWKYQTGAGQSMKVYVNRKLFRGNPRAIVLKPYSAITIEIGPPFSKPGRYTFPPGY